MTDMQAQMGAILNDPEMMQKIMAMANSLGVSNPPPEEEPAPVAAAMPQLDPALLQSLSGLAGQSSIDPDQKKLLRALGPYLKKDRIRKLEKAMQAAKMARFASSFIGQPGLFGKGR